MQYVYGFANRNIFVIRRIQKNISIITHSFYKAIFIYYEYNNSSINI